MTEELYSINMQKPRLIECDVHGRTHLFVSLTWKDETLKQLCFGCLAEAAKVHCKRYEAFEEDELESLERRMKEGKE